jgi:hypothetical protein
MIEKIDLPRGKYLGHARRDVPAEDSELTHVGPGTPCGEYMRRYWQPVAMTAEVTGLPQAIRRVLPPLGNQFVYMLKMSSLVSVIGLMELTRRANELTVTECRPLEIYTVLVVEYLVLILIVSYFVRRLERRMQIG